MAKANRRYLYRRASVGADFTCLACPDGWSESLLFLPGVQAIIRYPTASLSYRSANRTGKVPVGRAQVFGDRDRLDARLQRDQCVHGGISEGNRTDAAPLSPGPW